jgi:uncharacterized protein
MYTPNTQDIKRLHRKYAPTDEAFDLVFTHCNIVWDIAYQLITNGNFAIDSELVQAGCLLHDVGVYSLFDTSGKELTNSAYITHGIRGEEILKAEGFPEIIYRFASHHTGVGLSKQDILLQKLPLPIQDYEAETTEELLVMYADKFHSKTQPPYFNPFGWYKSHVGQFGPGKAERLEAMAKQFGLPDLSPLSEKYGHQIRKD